MARKKPLENSFIPAVDGTAVAPASAAKTARAPRAASAAVTHKHKKAASTAEVETAPATVTAPTMAPQPPSYEEISIRAYLIAEGRGFVGGSPDSDWLQAERELLAERQTTDLA